MTQHQPQTPNAQALDITTLEVRRKPDLEQEAQTWPQRAQAVTITDQASYDVAIELVKAAKALRNEAEAHHRPMIDAAYKSHKTALAGLNSIDAPLASAEMLIKTKIGTWDREQANKRMLAEREAREKAEREAAEALEADIEDLEAAGAPPVEIAAVIEEAERRPTPVYIPPPTYQKAKGITTPVAYTATVLDIDAVIKFVAGSPEFAGILQINQAALNSLARSMKENLKIPGVRVNKDTRVGVRL